MPQQPPSPDVTIKITVPYQDRPLERPSTQRVRRLRRHLLEALQALRAAKRPDRLIQQQAPDPPEAVAKVLRAGCTACRGHCCLGGGEHAWLDERTMARVRRDRPELNARGIIRAYVEQVAPLSHAGSCLFHGPDGCTLDRGLRAELCSSFYCDGLATWLRRRPTSAKARPRVVIHAIPPSNKG